MVRLSRRSPSGGVSTYHVVHGHEVPVPVVVEALERMVPVRLTLVPGPPADPTLLERHARLHPAMAHLLYHQRRFDDTRTRALLGERGPETPVDLEYLLSGLGLARANGSMDASTAARPAIKVPSPVPPDGCPAERDRAATGSAAPPSPLRSLTFIVTAGRSGSSALSAILNSHPDVLSLSEFFLCLRTMLRPPTGVISAATFWRALSAPHPVFDALVRGGAAMPEFLYPGLAGTRFSAGTGGIPAVCMTVLPHLSDRPDQLFDELTAEVPSWPDQPAARHCLRLFAWLAERSGRTIAVERSGFSLGSILWLRQQFPSARFVHLRRNGPDSAVSMSRHAGFRLLLLFLEAMGAFDLRTLPDGAPERAAAFDPAVLPIGLAPVLGDRYDGDYLMNLDLPVTRFATMWSELIRTGVAALSGLPAQAVMTLSYEDLIAEPQERLRELAAFIGVTASAPWLHAGAAALDPSRTGAATRLPPPVLDEVRQRSQPGETALAARAAPARHQPHPVVAGGGG